MVIVQLAMLVYCRVQYPLSFKAPVRIVSELFATPCEPKMHDYVLTFLESISADFFLYNPIETSRSILESQTAEVH